MDFSKVTKRELAQYCTDLEDELDKAVRKIEELRADTGFETFKREAVLLGQDVLKLVGYVYSLGVTTGKQFYQLVEQYKQREVKVPFMPETVNNDVPFLY